MKIYIESVRLIIIACVILCLEIPILGLVVSDLCNHLIWSIRFVSIAPGFSVQSVARYWEILVKKPENTSMKNWHRVGCIGFLETYCEVHTTFFINYTDVWFWIKNIHRKVIMLLHHEKTRPWQLARLCKSMVHYLLPPKYSSYWNLWWLCSFLLHWLLFGNMCLFWDVAV